MAADKPTFYLQSEHKLEISEDGKTWMRLAGGISELEPDGNEEVSQMLILTALNLMLQEVS
ncbi:hypothetical protein [Streptococcus equi]|uniref:hypothetical protein n=1 Tax=Streptococcus equi TaxID=1336 RepID=UPI001E655F4E|nr:hypothetical protein [Streptococcus equi]MCD3486548.1 hypothetical protein [Streptococcus equi subsp. equi]